MVSLILLLGLTEILLLVFLMESLSWLFIFLLKGELVLKYLLVQSLFFLLFMVGVLWISKVTMLFFLLKLGLPPFHLWFLRLRSFLEKQSFGFISTIHKFSPIFIFSKMIGLVSLRLIVISVLMRGLVFVSVSEVFTVLIVSSMIHSRWILFRSWVSAKLVLFYFSLYRILVYLFLFGLSRLIIKYVRVNQSFLSNIVWLIFSGLPPFSLFWLKVLIIRLVVFNMFIYSIAFIIVSVISLFVYYRVFHIGLIYSYFYKNKGIRLIPFFSFFGFF